MVLGPMMCNSDCIVGIGIKLCGSEDLLNLNCIEVRIQIQPINTESESKALNQNLSTKCGFGCAHHYSELSVSDYSVVNSVNLCHLLLVRLLVFKPLI